MEGEPSRHGVGSQIPEVWCMGTELGVPDRVLACCLRRSAGRQAGVMPSRTCLSSCFSADSSVQHKYTRPSPVRLLAQDLRRLVCAADLSGLGSGQYVLRTMDEGLWGFHVKREPRKTEGKGNMCSAGRRRRSTSTTTLLVRGVSSAEPSLGSLSVRQLSSFPVP